MHINIHIFSLRFTMHSLLKQQIKSKDQNQKRVLCSSFTCEVGCVLLTENRCVGAVPESGSFWGVFDKHSNCHRVTVKHTCKRCASAVCLCQAKISRSVTVKSWMCDTLIWHRSTFALRDTVRGQYLFSQIIKVNRGSSVFGEVNRLQRGRRSKPSLLATWYVDSFLRWTSCCSASCCRGERRRRLSETEGEKRSGEEGKHSPGSATPLCCTYLGVGLH